LSEEEAARFAVQRPRFPGVDIQARLARQYPLGELGSHAIGYVGAVSESDLQRLDTANYAGTAQTGKVGAERAWEHLLHGTTGYRQLLVNAQGRTLQELERTDAVPGLNVYLTIDLELQVQVAEEALQGRRGSVVALDPRNGEVLALVSVPGFDPNLFSMGISSAQFRALQNDIDQPLFNRALRGQYPPGSTIKPMLALAGLHYNVIRPQDTHFLPRLVQPAEPLPPLPRLAAPGPRHGEPGGVRRAVLRRLLLPPGGHAGHRAHARLPFAVQPRPCHRHRHPGRTARAACPRASGSAAPSGGRRTRPGFPGKP
jgi:cell division protein FtsI/penicillin-binding protein 2